MKSIYAQRARQRLIRRLTLATLAAVPVVGVLWVYGLVAFVDNIPRTVQDTTTDTNAIVILTGGSERVSSGLELLSSGKAKKMLISGAGAGVDLETLLIFSGPLPDNIHRLMEDISIEHAAQNTKGNAHETSRWMAQHHFTSLRLVTAHYHTPRSVLEFSKAMPGVRLVSHPVFPENVVLHQWWKSSGSKKLLVSEYNKYLASKLLTFIGS